ncbi:hypothetical protein [Flavobacterium limnosediminis]|uniref:hypothetical protein n=1 Tax=Flavobacterium limnosediminis TaxID=1401027 RepID=UPI0004052E15|nr:hypothetical protein [Flavobacterium limnosediminis]
MDYLDTYNKYYNLALENGEAIARQSLESLKKEKRNSNFAYNRTLELLETHLGVNIISKNESLTNLERYFENSLSKYDEDHIELVLKNEITEFYNKLSTNQLPQNYSFILMIEDLANYRGLKEIARLFRNQSTLYDMMYKLNDFGRFKIENYDNIHYEDTPLFNELRKRLYPSNNNIETIVDTSEKQKNTNENIMTDNTKKNEDFSDIEKGLLLMTTYKILEEYNKDTEGALKIECTEFYKVLSIVNLNDISSLAGDNYKNSFNYRILTSGIEYVDKELKTQDAIFDILISKTKKSKLRSVTKYLSKKSTLLKAKIALNEKKAKNSK